MTVCPTREMLGKMGTENHGQSYVLLPLNCYDRDQYSEGQCEAILLRWQHDRTYMRVPSQGLYKWKYGQVSRDSTVFVGKDDKPVTFLIGSGSRKIIFQLPDKGVTFLQDLSPVKGDYDPSRYTFSMAGVPEVPCKLAFVFHLEEFTRLLLVAIRLNGTGTSGKQETDYIMVTDVLPVESTTHYEKRIVKFRDQWISETDDTTQYLKVKFQRLSRSVTQDQVQSIKSRPVGDIFTQDVKIRSADGLTKMMLRVSLVKEAVYRDPTYVLRLSFIGSRLPSI
ncbi:hypothetical protein PG985_003768 [Apiospora marii]|uniref:Uncharacterized protein n=1 Tax=Apiospora marii TaxID=335849 RepID=A0ABR1SH49_9PEZI